MKHLHFELDQNDDTHIQELGVSHSLNKYRTCYRRSSTSDAASFFMHLLARMSAIMVRKLTCLLQKITSILKYKFCFESQFSQIENSKNTQVSRKILNRRVRINHTAFPLLCYHHRNAQLAFLLSLSF